MRDNYEPDDCALDHLLTAIGGSKHMVASFFMVLFDYQVSITGVKTLGLTFKLLMVEFNNGELLAVSLLKALFEVEISSG